MYHFIASKWELERLCSYCSVGRRVGITCYSWTRYHPGGVSLVLCAAIRPMYLRMISAGYNAILLALLQPHSLGFMCRRNRGQSCAQLNQGCPIRQHAVPSKRFDSAYDPLSKYAVVLSHNVCAFNIYATQLATYRKPPTCTELR